MIISSPYFLWALGLLCIPIIIHLFQFKRYKKLYFPDISLLREAKIKSKSQNRLKDILILISRLAFIAALVMAFSEPIIPAHTNSGSIQAVSIYIDNSFSMQNEGMNGPLINEATQAAYEISDSYGANVRLQLITNDFQHKQKRFSNHEDFLTELDKLEISGKHRSIEELMKFQNSNEELGKHLLYIISDFKAVLDTAQNQPVAPDTTLEIRLLPLETQYIGNVSVDSAWTEEPLFQKGVNQTLFFRITNHGDEPLESFPVKISINSIPPQSPVLSLPPQSSLDTSINLELGDLSFISGSIAIEDYPITFDNVLHFSIPVVKEVHVSIIHGASANSNAISSVFMDVPFQTVSMDESSLDLGKLERADFIVLNEITQMNSGIATILKDHLADGKNVLIIPAKNTSPALASTLSEELGINLGSWDTLGQKVVKVNENSKLYNQVFEESDEQIDMPAVHGHWKCVSCNEERILTLLDGSALISGKTFSKGEVFKISSPLNDETTNLHKHALFVPALINMAIRSQIEQRSYYVVTSTHLPFHLHSEEAKISMVGDSSYFIPSSSFEGIVVQDRFNEAGIYELYEQDSMVNRFAMNYSREESRVESPMTEPVLKYLRKSGLRASSINNESTALKNDILEADLGVKLWPLFVLISLIFLVVETVLLKVLKG